VAERIQRETGTTPELIDGHDGIFEVRVGDQVAFTNVPNGGVPEPEEVVRAVTQVMSVRH
jgi:predicted Rdx family selenoprotein